MEEQLTAIPTMRMIEYLITYLSNFTHYLCFSPNFYLLAFLQCIGFYIACPHTAYFSLIQLALLGQDRAMLPRT